MSQVQQADIDARNIDFWNELCGTQLARSLGIIDSSSSSLKKFDDFYFGFYPYLRDHIPFDQVRGQKILEVGLGYGTVSQKLAESGALYTGLDIAPGPVEMVNHRLEQLRLPGEARQGNILEAPFQDNTFDGVVTIGCLHHTGNIQQALDEIHRVLRPGGWAVVMTYNAYSYRRWWNNPKETLSYLAWDYLKIGAPSQASLRERAAYDLGTSGAAPETVFVSARSFKRLSRKFSRINITKENADQEAPFKKYPRERLLPLLGKALGLDLYTRLTK
ncbi:MAG: class I SAM-dependent methyltransferase [Candidatus Saccharimonadales bacterium]